MQMSKAQKTEVHKEKPRSGPSMERSQASITGISVRSTARSTMLKMSKQTRTTLCGCRTRRCKRELSKNAGFCNDGRMEVARALRTQELSTLRWIRTSQQGQCFLAMPQARVGMLRLCLSRAEGELVPLHSTLFLRLKWV